MDSLVITNSQELHAEIARLRVESARQLKELAVRFNSPSALFSTARSLFKKKRQPDEGKGHGDFTTLIARLLIPLGLNKSIFRNSGFVVKMLVDIVSQKAAGLVTEGSIESVIHEGKNLLNKLFHRSVPEQQPPMPTTKM